MSMLQLLSRRCIAGSPNNQLLLFYGIIYSFSHSSVIKMLSVDYEVFGRVQGVFFRKYTQKKAKELGLTGWVRNTSQGTVVGQMEGNDKEIAEMKNWLKNVGSPHSRIERCEFKNEKEVSKSSFRDFVVKS